MNFPFPPELLGLRPQWADANAPSFGERIDQGLQKRQDDKLSREQLAETQRMHRTNEEQQQNELAREKNKDALGAQIAQSKLDRKLSTDEEKLFWHYEDAAQKASAVGDSEGVRQARQAQQVLMSRAGPEMAESAAAPPGVHQGMAGPAFGGSPEAPPPQRPFVDQGGLEFAQSPSGAFRTSKPGTAQPEPEAAPPATSPPPQAPQGAFGTGFDTSKVGATNPHEVDSSAIASAFMGLPVSAKHKIITLADQVIRGGPESPESDLSSNPPEYGSPPPAQPEGKWAKAPGGRTMQLEEGGRPGVESVVAMWKSRLASAQDPVERAGAEAAMNAASVSQNAQKAQDESQKAYDGALRRFKREGAGGGGGGPGVPSEKQLKDDYAFDLSVSKDKEGKQYKDARNAADAADRVLNLLNPSSRTGYKDVAALDTNLRALIGGRVNVQQLKMTMASAGKGEEFGNLLGQYLDGGKLTPEFARQMRDAAQVAKESASEVMGREVHGAEEMIRGRYGHRPEKEREGHVRTVHDFITGGTEAPKEGPTKADRATLEQRAEEIRRRLQGAK